MIGLFFKDSPMNKHINGELSTRRFYYMNVDRFIFKTNLITLFSRFVFIPKTVVGLPKTGFSFFLC